MNAGQFSHNIAFYSQILCEICCIILSIKPQRAVANPIAHSLPHKFLVSVYGSQVNGRCTSMTEGIAGDGISICDGTSVLNDGIIPTLGEISSDPQSQWASQLFTMNRTVTDSGVDNITLSFQVERTQHDRMEIAVFNCPQKGIHTPVINVFVDGSFRPLRAPISLFQTSASLQTTSCNHLLKFCVKFHGSLLSQYYSIQLPYQQGSNFVFLGEVTFLNAVGEPCDPRTPDAITAPSTLPIIGPTSQAALWPESTTQVDEATSPHLQDLVTTQKVINHHATTTDSKSDLPDQTSTQGTQEMQNNNTTAIVLSIVFTMVLILIIVLVAVVIIVKLSRTANCKHKSDDSACQVLLQEDSNSLQEEKDVYISTVNLDKVLDSDTNGELHLGQIADVMTEWEGSIADNLDLSPADISRIKTAHPAKLDLQTRAALRKWKQRKGSEATYKNLIEVFKHAHCLQYANIVRNICAHGYPMKMDDTRPPEFPSVDD